MQIGFAFNRKMVISNQRIKRAEAWGSVSVKITPGAQRRRRRRFVGVGP
jgi:hypothetical protein